MRKKNVCIHGHFYQPPREDPWLCEMLPEGSAGPLTHWDERICRESYAPIAWARRLDGEGKITEIINEYEWMSFNFGPTLLQWMEKGAPEAYQRMLEGDAASVRHFGHGNALAMVYHHIIMPLASELDKEVEVAWAVADFKARFKRAPEGMWLSETAVDIPTLEVLASAGIKFTVLAPRQAKAVAPLGNDGWQEVNEYTLNIDQPYEVELPSGKAIWVVFYHGGLSQAVAFERLLEDGEIFWNRIAGYFSGDRGAQDPVLLSLATDGETYGHHFPFGEMALAYVLGQMLIQRDEIELTNFSAYLHAHPPRMRVLLHEPSSWSCVHGVERWRSNCGCSTGGHPGWQQEWRGPLRNALNGLKERLDSHFFDKGAALFKDPKQALLAYGKVLAGSLREETFARDHFQAKLSKARMTQAWRLLSMQEWGLAMFASCAWFFDEITRIEPLNGLTYALRAMEFCAGSGGPGVDELEESFVNELEKAWSNYPEMGNGRDIWFKLIKPRTENEATLTAQALLKIWAQGRVEEGATVTVGWEGVSATVSFGKYDKNKKDVLKGDIAIHWGAEQTEDRFKWQWYMPEQGGIVENEFVVSRTGQAAKTSQPKLFKAGELSWKKYQALALEFIQEEERDSWQRRIARFGAGLDFFQPLHMEQSVQNLVDNWDDFWPAMAYAYVTATEFQCKSGHHAQDQGDRLLCDWRTSQLTFIKEKLQQHTQYTSLSERIVAAVLQALDGDKPDFDRARRIIERTGKLGLQMNWWPVQNRFWQLRKTSDQTGRVAALVGMNI